ncbi:MAG TPA: hypothetical protein VMF61_12140 [Candidatus Acidoferrales bacterium]|nr:hypothetical protein [Candidatus Acidoferrales bacterium]
MHRSILRSLFAAFSFAGLLACAAPAVPSGPELAVPAAARPKPVPCSALTTIRALHRQIEYVTDSATGDELEYLVIGDGARTKDVLVFFPGTGQIMTGWPIQMITNTRYSPKIAGDYGFDKSQDGSASLCHDYHLVLFDYPGVGRSPYAENATHDRVAREVDAMLQDVTARYGISTGLVDPVGWSLGTTYALKYAFLSPASRPSRTIHNVLLVSGHGGGSVDGPSGSGSASCISTLLTAAISATGSQARTIKSDATKLVFPYAGQRADQNGTDSGCRAYVTKDAVRLSVTPVCTVNDQCRPFVVNALASFATPPWAKTLGIDAQVYAQQRQASGDWDAAYCGKAGPAFTSRQCSSSAPVQQSITNGGICQTDTSNADRPASKVCAPLQISGHVRLLDGYEDLYVLWRYDAALADGLNAVKPGIAQYAIYGKPAGHGIMLQYPGWVEAQFAAAML